MSTSCSTKESLWKKNGGQPCLEVGVIPGGEGATGRGLPPRQIKVKGQKGQGRERKINAKASGETEKV